MRQKLDAKGLECIYLGKSETSKGIRAWDPIARKVHISRDYISDEGSSCNVMSENQLVDEPLAFPFNIGQETRLTEEIELNDGTAITNEAPDNEANDRRKPDQLEDQPEEELNNRNQMSLL